MKFDLNREYPEPGEDKLIEKMVKLAAERMKPQQGRQDDSHDKGEIS